MWLDVRNLSKNFGASEVLKNINFTLEKGKTLAILGKSGCGKTTLLKVLAGIETPDTGEAIRSGENILNLPLNQRNIIYLYQDSLLFTHLNVFENIAFGLRIRNINEEEIRHKVKEMLKELDMEAYAGAMPHELSGGQKQRVAFGRSLIISPDCLLLDEPFSSLDFQTRSAMQTFYKEISGRYSITSVFVTHDLKEALIMGDNFATMEAGTLKMYERKTAFINSPETGVLREKSFWDNINTDQ